MNGYICKKELLEFARNHVGGKIDANDIARFPCTDVVPKSEFEELRKQNDELIKNAVFSPMERAQTIVAVRAATEQELFEEINTLLKRYHIASLDVYEGELGGEIAELKKKHTEGLTSEKSN